MGKGFWYAGSEAKVMCDHDGIQTHVTEIDHLVVCSNCCPYCALGIPHNNTADKETMDAWMK